MLRMRSSLLIGIVVMTPLVASAGTPVSGGTDADNFRRDLERIRAFAQRSTSKAEESNVVNRLEAFGDEIAKTWRDTNIECYGQLTVALCGELGFYDLNAMGKGGLLRTLAMRALTRAEDVSLELECHLVVYAKGSKDANGDVIAGKEAQVLRRQQALLFLHAWKRIEDSIDDNWDPNDRPPMFQVAPPGSNYGVGVDPNSIEDPVVAAQYVAALKANSDKIKRNQLQRAARELRKYWIPGAHRFLISRYMEDGADPAELEGLLKEFVRAPRTREWIMAAVRDKKMPEELDQRHGAPQISTQPAK